MGKGCPLECQGMSPMELQIFSFIGAMVTLIAYVGHQMKWMDARKALYNVLNAAGSGILVYVAFHPFQVGFVIMETVWLIVSVYAVFRPRREASQ